MILMGQEFSRYIFEKYSKIKFDENQSCYSRVVPWGRRHRQADTTKLIFAFRNFANSPKKLDFNVLLTVHPGTILRK